MTTKLDLVIPQGSNYRFVVDVDGGPESLTGYEGWMQIRPSKDSQEVLAEFTDDDITVNPEAEQVVVEMSYTDTIDFEWHTGEYDLLITGPGGVWRLVEGRVSISHMVTREED